MNQPMNTTNNPPKSLKYVQNDLRTLLQLYTIHNFIIHNFVILYCNYIFNLGHSKLDFSFPSSARVS
jgi:hypothetical protein